MKKVTAWKTEDGVMFEDFIEAKEHEEKNTVMKNLDSLFASCDIARSYSDYVLETMVENRHAFIKALGGVVWVDPESGPRE